MKRLVIGSDHAGYEMKVKIVEYLQGKGYECVDLGTHSTDSCNYVEFGLAVGKAVASGEFEKGIVICGTGVGISISANKVNGIRAVVCSEPLSARLSREHNNSNILAFGARVVGIEMAKMIVDEWLAAEFQGGRHQARIDTITDYENNR